LRPPPRSHRSDPRQLGFGTGTAWYKDDPKDPTNPGLIAVLEAAIEKGLVHLDCADSYGTERE